MNSIRRKLLAVKENRAVLSQIGNACFIMFYVLMVMLKALGFSSYHMFYKAVFVVALLFLMVKVLTTKYTMREFLILYLLLGLSALCWIKVGEKNVLLITLMMWGLKGCNFERIIKYSIWIWVIGVLFMVTLSCVGLLDVQSDSAIATDFSLRDVYAFGYTKANAMFYIVFLCVALVLYINYEKLNLWYLLATSAVSLIAYEATFCRTGIITFIGLWGLIILDKITFSKRYYRLLSYSALGLFGISLVATVVYRKANSIMFKINRVFNGRIEIANNYYKECGIKLLPQDVSIFGKMNYTTLDNMYMYLLICCGIIVVGLYLFATTMCQRKLCQEQHYKEIIFSIVFAVFGVLEQSPFNPILNPFMLLLANMIYSNFI